MLEKILCLVGCIGFLTCTPIDNENNAEEVIFKENVEKPNYYVLGPKDGKKVILKKGYWEKRIFPDKEKNEIDWQWYNGGEIVLKMEKKIYDDKGYDFYISASGGEYEVFFSKVEDVGWINAGTFEGNTYFELKLDYIDYVKIVNVSEEKVKIDFVKEYAF